MCDCPPGCCATMCCGWLSGILNTAMMFAYGIGIILLKINCGDSCYPHYINEYLYILIMIVSAVVLYVIGFIVSSIAYKRGKGDILGCNLWIIIIIEVILLFTLVLCGWNLYHLMADSVNTDHSYPKLYQIMVFVNVGWNLFLIAITINVLKYNEMDKSVKRAPKGSGSFTKINNDEIDDFNDLELKQRGSSSGMKSYDDRKTAYDGGYTTNPFGNHSNDILVNEKNAGILPKPSAPQMSMSSFGNAWDV